MLCMPPKHFRISHLHATTTVVPVPSLSGTQLAPQLYGTACVRYTVEAMIRSDVELMLDVKAGDMRPSTFCCRSIACRW